MAVLTEGTYLGEIIAREWDQSYTRETFVAEGAITMGMTLKTGTAGTQKKPTVVGDTTAVNAIALTDAADTKPVVCLVRGPVIVKDPGLTYPASASDSQKAAHRAGLKSVGIVVTTQVV